MNQNMASESPESSESIKQAAVGAAAVLIVVLALLFALHTYRQYQPPMPGAFGVKTTSPGAATGAAPAPALPSRIPAAARPPQGP